MVTTKTVWNRVGFEIDPNIQTQKTAWIADKVSEGKTTLDVTTVDDLTRTKDWVDQETANEWTIFITNLASQNGYTVTVTTI